MNPMVWTWVWLRRNRHVPATAAPRASEQEIHRLVRRLNARKHGRYGKDNRRAMAALLRMLSPEQQQNVVAHDWFDVITPAGHYYRVACTLRSANVFRYSPRTQRVIQRYCAVTAAVPEYDLYLAQAMLLRMNEAKYLDIAYRSDLYGGKHIDKAVREFLA